MGVNAYQKRTVSLQEVTDRLLLPRPDQIPQILLSVSPCRSGTTVLLRVFGAAGVPAYYQELKNIYRWRMQAEERQWQIPIDREMIYLKETLGPYTLAEARFNPLEVLLNAGIPRERLKVFIVGRNPIDTWASWFSWWKSVTNLDILIQAYRTVENIRVQAQAEGLLATTFLYDILQDHNTETAIQILFSKLDIPFTPVAVRGWKDLPAFGQPGSNVFLPEEPPAFDIPDLHKQVEKSNQLAYYNRARELCISHPDACDYLRQSDIFEIYERWHTACENDFGIKITAME